MASIASTGAQGLSPRVRGNLGLPDWPDIGGVYPRVCGGTLPTSSIIKVYPRVCGGTRGHNYAGSRVYPRVCGGTLLCSVVVRWQYRSIPACAGEPSFDRITVCPLIAQTVYPRVCGGTGAGHSAAGRADWVYPRVCGGTVRWPGVHGSRRSIPACAGEPPRGNGPRKTGLSPRVRGNPGRTSHSRRGVYPRVCGGTRGPMPYPRVCGGTRLDHSPLKVYPRVCGGTLRAVNSPRSSGSIPACAGEPLRLTSGCMSADERVYPRVCGGTIPGQNSDRSAARQGSIPACAGEPSTQDFRSCHFGGGLSPRVRGNRLASHDAPCGVYPRVCGGTEWR